MNVLKTRWSRYVTGAIVVALTGATYLTTTAQSAKAIAPTIDVPAPATLLLFGAGLVGLHVLRRRKNKKTS